MVKESTIKELIERHRRFWNRSEAKRPLIQIQAGGYRFVLHGVKVSFGPGRLQADMVKPAEFMDSFNWEEPIRPDGDLFVVNVPTPLDWVENIIGCSVVVGGESMWTEPSNRPLRELTSLRLTPDNPWLTKLAEFTRNMVETSGGRVPLAHTLMRGPSDMVSVLASHAAFCTAIYDSPDELHQVLDRCTEIWPVVYRAQQDNIPQWHGGYCSSYGIWTPGTFLRTQEDASALISRQHYREFLETCDERTFQLADYSTIHLHSGSLQTVEPLLEHDNLAAIQISLDTPAGPSVPNLMPVFKQVLENKPLIISGPCTLVDFQLMVEELSPVGLCIVPRFEDNPEEADLARQWFRGRFGIT